MKNEALQIFKATYPYGMCGVSDAEALKIVHEAFLKAKKQQAEERSMIGWIIGAIKKQISSKHETH